MTQSDHDFLTIEAASRKFSLSISTLRRRIGDGKIAAVQPGGPRTMWLIPANALDTLRPAKTESVANARKSTRRAGPKPQWKRT